MAKTPRSTEEVKLPPIISEPRRDHCLCFCVCAVGKNGYAKGTVRETQQPPEKLGFGRSGPQHRHWKVMFLTYMLSLNPGVLHLRVGLDQVLHFRLAKMKKKKKDCGMNEVGEGHPFTGVTGLTVPLWFGSQEVSRVLEFMPSEPESPFYFKAVIRDVAKKCIYPGYFLHIS